MTNNTFPNPPTIDDVRDNSYFITFTLQPQLYKYKAKRQLRKTISTVESLLRVYTDNYILAAELTKTCNIHYHAIVNWTDKFEYAMDKFIDANKLSRTLGMCKVNQDVIIEKERTLNYLLKDYKRTHSVINSKTNKMTEEDTLFVWKRPPFSPRKPNTNTKQLDIDSDTEYWINYAEKCIAIAPTVMKCSDTICKMN